MRRLKNKKSRHGAGWAVLAVLVLLAAGAGLMFAMWRGYLPNRYFLKLRYRSEILASSEDYGLDPCFVAAVISTESGFDKDAVSGSGAVGLMQLLPSTAEWIASMRGTVHDDSRLCEPAYNIDMGCWLMQYLMDRYGSARYALIAYNAGHGRLESWLAEPDYLNEEGELSVIPYGETEAYVARVESRTEQYRKLYGEQLEKAEDRG